MKLQHLFENANPSSFDEFIKIIGQKQNLMLTSVKPGDTSIFYIITDVPRLSFKQFHQLKDASFEPGSSSLAKDDERGRGGANWFPDLHLDHLIDGLTMTDPYVIDNDYGWKPGMKPDPRSTGEGRKEADRLGIPKYDKNGFIMRMRLNQIKKRFEQKGPLKIVTLTWKEFVTKMKKEHPPLSRQDSFGTYDEIQSWDSD